MKYLMIVLLMVSCFSCEKEEAMPFDNYSVEYIGECSLTINGEEQIFSTHMSFSYGTEETVGLSIVKLSPEGFKRRGLGISSVPLNLELLPLVRSTTQDVIEGEASYHSLLGDGDVLGNSYVLIERDSIEDFLQLTSINMDTREVKGTFQLSLSIGSLKDKVDPTMPDTIIITDGYFETILQDRQ